MINQPQAEPRMVPGHWQLDPGPGPSAVPAPAPPTRDVQVCNRDRAWAASRLLVAAALRLYKLIRREEKQQKETRKLGSALTK